MDKNIFNFNRGDQFTPKVDEQIISSFLVKTFVWMFIGIAMTAATVFAIINSITLTTFIFGQRWPMFVALLAQFGVVMFTTSRQQTLSISTTRTLFIVFSILNGVSLSFLGFYDPKIVGFVLAMTTALFGIMAAYGYLTNEDLSKFGSMLNVALIILIGAGLVNIFLKMALFNLVIGYVGALVFMVFIAFDVNRLKNMAAYISIFESKDSIEKYAVMGAFSLYLNFVNLFLYILRIFSNGNRKD